MPLPLESVVKQLSDSGIVSQGKLENFVPPKAHPKDAQELITELVKQNQITKFQAQQIAAGKAKSLILGEYTILDRIGAGGMGQVFKALHRRMERVVAIKMLPPTMTKDTAALARFQREVVAAAKLEHPNIVHANDAGQAGTAHFLVMQYVEGKDLSAMVKKDGPLSVDKAVNYLLQAARGLEYAHKRGVIHRDIKPANLLLDAEGTVKILDMGLARIDSGGNAPTQAELTGTGAVMGTVDYMAPEQARSTHHADARADIYSLGCSLFYLLTARPLYDGDTVTAKLIAHQFDPIPTLGDIRPDVPPEVQAVYEKMIAKKVEDRYQSMTEVIADLQSCLPSPLAAEGSGVRAHNTDSASNSNLSFLKDAAATHTVQRTTHKHTQAARPTPSPTRRVPKRAVLIGAGVLSAVLLLAAIIVSLRTKDGTLIVEIDQPDATVQVLDADGKVEVSQKGGAGKVTISVDPGKHRLRVEKDGFAVFGQEFEMEQGGKKEITARLEGVETVAGQPNKPWNTPAFQAWIKSVQVLTAEEQANAVQEKLGELNPGLDTKYRTGREIKDDAVIEWRFSSANKLIDLSPVRALSQMKSLVLSTCPDLEDLSPLEGMSLTLLHLHANKVKNFSPLKGMPLTALTVSFTPVTDVSPLAGMRLQQLHLHACSVKDLSVLQGMPLTELTIGALSIKDLASLRGLPLQKLTFNGGLFSDLTPLKDMPLIELNCGNTRVTDVTPLYACKDLRLATFTHNKLTAAAIAALQKALPNCKIEWDDPTKPMTPAAPLGPAPPVAKAPFDATQAKQHQQAWADYLGIEVETPNSVGMKMVLIPPGEFMMGSTDAQVEEALKVAGEIKADETVKGRIERTERPQHKVVVTKPFQTSATEVTVGQFKKFSATGYVTEVEKATQGAKTQAYLSGGNDDLPAAYITWNDAVAYCQWLSTQEKRIYRLPTEAEWEYACRAGTTTQYSFGDDYNELPKYAWHKANAGGKWHPVGTLLSNPFGLLDMHGNLSEWCGDYYDEKRYSASTPNDPNGPAAGSQRVNRGSAWDYTASHCRSASRTANPPSTHYHSSGFRCVAELAVPTSTPAPSTKLFLHDPTFPQWLAQVQAMPAEEQIAAVLKKLIELNPGFDGVVTGAGDTVGGPPSVRNNAVTAFGFNNNHVVDLSPLRAFSSLEALRCNGTYQGGRAKLSDLSPLRGLKLTFLQFDSTSVVDLAPLVGMPLKDLRLRSTAVTDLSPLEGCSSLVQLYLQGVKVTPASVAAFQKALPNCKIEWDDPAKAPGASAPASPKLFMHDPAFPQWIKDVQAMPAEEQINAVSKKLVEFNPGFDGQLRGRDGKGPPTIANGLVTLLHMKSQSAFNDLSPIQAFTGLRELVISDCPKMSDLAGLHGMKLNRLMFRNSPVSDLSPLGGMPLEYCDCTSSRVSGLSPLKSCQRLTSLRVKGTKVTPATIAALQKALPNCKIEWDDPSQPKTP